VQRMMKGTGVLKVYLVQSRRYAYRMHFMRAITPGWVLEELNDLTDAKTFLLTRTGVSPINSIPDTISNPQKIITLPIPFTDLE